MDEKSDLGCGITVDKRRASLLRHLLQNESGRVDALKVGEATRYVAARHFGGVDEYLKELNELHKELYDIEQKLKTT